MRDGIRGISLSLALHALVLAPFLMLPAVSHQPLQTMVLDFSLIPGEKGERPGRAAPGAGGRKDVTRSPQGRYDNTGAPPVASAAAEPSSHPAATAETRPSVLTEAGGAVAVGLHGPAGTADRRAGPAGGSSARATGAGGSGGQGKVLDYGSGDGGLKEFAFIREAILKNIRYPEKARRMGWEGRVILAFTVAENGSIEDVRIAGSSGVPLLDDDAREALRRTRFSRPVPARLLVTLPVEYRLER